MFEAAANNKMILTSDTQTTQEYFDECQRMGKDVRQWRVSENGEGCQAMAGGHTILSGARG